MSVGKITSIVAYCHCIFLSILYYKFYLKHTHIFKLTGIQETRIIKLNLNI